MNVADQQPALRGLTGALSPELHVRAADLESIVDELRLAHDRRPDLLPQTSVYLGPASSLGTQDPASVLPPAPALRLSVAAVRLLLRALLPLPRLALAAVLALLRYQRRHKLAAVLALLRYQRRHKLAAYWSHRKRRLQRLETFKPP